MKNPINAVKITWPMPVTRDIFPMSLMRLGSRLMPTIKRRKATPSCEKSASGCDVSMRLRTFGPRRMPVAR